MLFVGRGHAPADHVGLPLHLPSSAAPHLSLSLGALAAKPTERALTCIFDIGKDPLRLVYGEPPPPYKKQILLHVLMQQDFSLSHPEIPRASWLFLESRRYVLTKYQFSNRAVTAQVLIYTRYSDSMVPK